MTAKRTQMNWDTSRERLLRTLLAQRSQARPVAPIAPEQEQLFRSELERPGGYGHTDLLAVEITGSLDEAALARALTRMQARHEGLRARFVAEPIAGMVTRPPGEVRPRRADVCRGQPRQARARAAAIVRQLLSQPLNPFEGTSTAPTLIRLSPGTHLLLTPLHHLVSDAHSHGIYVRDLAYLYEAAVGGAAARLPAAPPYGEYARYAIGRRTSGAWAASMRYWAGVLAPPLPAIPWPASPERRRYVQHRIEHTFSAAATARCKDAAARSGITIAMAVAAGWSAALHATTGARDVRLGVPFANRMHDTFQNTIGLFANMGVVRLRPHRTSTVRELARQTRTAMLGAFEHGYVPLQQILTGLRERVPEFAPRALYETDFHYAAAPVAVAVPSGPVFRPAGAQELDLAPEPAFQPAVLTVTSGAGGGTRIALGHDRDIIPPPLGRTLLTYVADFLAALASCPDDAIGGIGSGGTPC
jgi:Condensation domain